MSKLPTTLLLATQNPGKIAEAKALLARLRIEVVSLTDIGLTVPEPKETGETFAENALLKARYYAIQSKLACLADDSGLEVEALGGRPGIFSARYVSGSDTDRNLKILKEMEGIPKHERTAKFVCVVAFVDPVTEMEQTFLGECKGKIALKMMGSDGFGYDPIFVPQPYSQTMAQLGPEQKNKLSHRFKAINAFIEWWKEEEIQL